jgi:hypothetical protein
VAASIETTPAMFSSNTTARAGCAVRGFQASRDEYRPRRLYVARGVV